MPDYKVTFRGDLGNLAQFDAAIKNSAISSRRAFEQANANIVSSLGKITGAYEAIQNQPGLFLKNQRTVADAVNKTFRQTSEVVRRFAADYEVVQNKMGKFEAKRVFSDAYVSNINKARGNLEAYNEALGRVAKSEAEIVRGRAAFARLDAGNRNRVAANDVRRQGVLDLIRENPAIRNLETQRVIAERAYERSVSNLAAHPGGRGLAQLKKAVADTKAELTKATADLAAARAPFEAQLAKLDALDAKINASTASAARALQQRERTIFRRQGFKDLDIAANVTPPIQADLARVLNDSEQLRKKLLKSGLGGGAAYGGLEFQRQLAQQEAAVTSYTRNLRTGVRTVDGQFKDAQGLLQRFTVDLDEQGKVIGRWGGQLGGAGSILKQTVRDFQKVIEWTVATTVVFGTLSTVVTQLQNINELNTLLARFSITAQTSAQETAKFFDTLTEVAIDTATPLKEIITVADDIALATREAGDSTEEWQGKIVDLTRAVGIFTNLTGKDTVQAADQLSAAFKQLDIAPDQLITVLNKVTAVAGGQANAIADIVQSVSGLAEAARAAGFNVDEMIAGVQVLSQVTNKTSAEVATAFKNLFGSVTSVGSEKILSQFGIAIRDASGGVRDFLDIYRDVRRALDQGIIPQNRLPDVLRGIAGGPRRAPDAAALLSNIGRIDEVIARSVGASNEALIANAKILDTNQAKLIQFQNSVDATVFKQFGEAVEQLVGALVDLSNVFNSVFGGIPKELITAAIQLGLLVGLAGALSKAFGFLGKNLGITAMITQLRGLGTALKTVSVDAKQAAADAAFASRFPNVAGSGLILPAGAARGGTAPVVAGSRLGRLRGAVGGRGIGAVAGIAGAAGLGAAAGIDPGSVLQLAGGVAALVPGLQAVGIAAIVAGTAMQLLSTNSEEAKDNTAQLSQEIYALTQGLKDTNTEAAGYAAQQKSALATIKDLRATNDEAAGSQAALSAATTEYVTATLGLVDANKRVEESFQGILDKLELGGKYQSFIDGLKKGGLDANNPELKRLMVILAEDILRNTGQGIFTGAQVALADTFRRGGTPGGSTATYGFGNKRTGINELDLASLVNNPEMLRQLFNLTPESQGTAFYGRSTGNIPANDINIRYLQSALSQLFEQFQQGEGTFSNEELQLLTKAIQELSVSIGSFAQNTIALTQQAALIQAKTLTGAFTTEQGQRATSANTLAQQLNQITSNYTPIAGREGKEYIEPGIQRAIELIKQLSDAANEGTKVSVSTLAEAARLVLQYSDAWGDLKLAGEDAIGLGIIEKLKQAGVEQEILDALTKQYVGSLQEASIAASDLSGNLDEAKKRARERFAERSLDLTIAENSGQFEENAAGLKVLQEQNKAAYDTTIQLIDALGSLTDESFVELNNALSNVIGLQGLFITNTELAALGAMEQDEQVAFLSERVATLSDTLVENAVKAGVNAEGIRKIKDEVLKLIPAILAIPPYKKVIIDIQTKLNTLPPTVLGGGDYGKNLQTQLNTAKQQQAAAKASGNDPASIINDFIRTYNSILGSGSGSSLGSSPASSGGRAGRTGRTGGSTPYNKPGLLDIPEEILLQSNASSLIQQAVKNARRLQSQVPGESKANKNEIVELLNGTKRVLETRGVGEEYLRRAMDELRDEIKRQNDLLSKADTIRRIRVGGGDFSAIANVPINSKSGVSVGGLGGPISVSLDVNGTVFTPAQLSQFADMVAASLKRQLAS